ncbi:MAG: hypothetical protein AMXMBFR23_09180 [Chloroflexota bacterium]
MPALAHRLPVAALALAMLLLAAWRPAPAAAQTAGLLFPAPTGQTWEVLAGYNTPTHEGVDPYALDLWRVDSATGDTPLLAPMSGTVGYISDTCVSVRTSEVNLLMCHVHALPGLERGQPVLAGQRLGTVARDGEAENFGTAHIHLQLNARTDGRAGESLPFDGAYRLEGVALPATPAFNAYAGTRFRSTNDPANAVLRVNGGTDRLVDPGAVVSLTATGNNVDQYHWMQTAGPLVALTNEGMTATFQAPSEPGAVVVLQVYGAGPLGVTSDEVRVTVRASAEETRGRILAGSVAPAGISLVVFGGGSTDELHASAGCPSGNVTYWATVDGGFVGYIPGAPAAVNARWLQAFPTEIPAHQPLLVRCG